MIIRPATLSDADIIIPLTNKVYSQSEGHFWVKDWQRLDVDTFTQYINQQSVFLALQDGSVVGCVYVKKEEEMLNFGMLVCHPDHRGKGIGTFILDYVIRIAKDEGCQGVSCDCIFPIEYEDEHRMFLDRFYVSKGFSHVKDVSSDVLGTYDPVFPSLLVTPVVIRVYVLSF